MLLVRDIGSKKSLSDFTNGIQKDSELINRLTEEYPEFRIMHHHMRVHFLLGDDMGVTLETVSHFFHDWMLGEFLNFSSQWNGLNQIYGSFLHLQAVYQMMGRQ